MLGPVLFLIYIDDLLDCFSCQSLLFADDLKLWCNVTEHNTNPALQADLHKLEEWTQLWLIKVNPTKCEVMCLRWVPSTVQ